MREYQKPLTIRVSKPIITKKKKKFFSHSITIDCEAKRIMVRENAIAILTDLLLDENESVLLNVVKTITNCAEDYRGRFQLLGCIKKLEAFKFSSNTQLAESSKKAIQVITWRP